MGRCKCEFLSDRGRESRYGQVLMLSEGIREARWAGSDFFLNSFLVEEGNFRAGWAGFDLDSFW